MHNENYFVIEKSGWPRGPWDHEPDVFAWLGEGTGMVCLAKRNPRYGVWLGYVGVTRDHPSYEKPFEDTIFLDLTPHGGLTFTGRLEDQSKSLWWFGFDCGHFPDYAPALVGRERKIGWEDLGGVENYRTFEYVKAECEKLARQLWQIQVDALAEHIKPSRPDPIFVVDLTYGEEPRT